MYYTGEDNPHLDLQINKLGRDIKERNAQIVIFTLPYPTEADIPPYRMTPSTFKAMFNLVVLREFSDGYVMGTVPEGK